jgi:hypothetical protein
MTLIPEILHKLARLAESGVGGERENARRKLAELLAQRGLTLEDLSRTETQMAEFPVATAQEETVLVQIIATVTQADVRYTQRTRRGKRTSLHLPLTPTHASDVREQWAHFRPLLQREQRALAARQRAQRKQLPSAFIHANKIFPANAGDARPLTPDELREALAMLAQARQMDAQPYQPARPQLAA